MNLLRKQSGLFFDINKYDPITFDDIDTIVLHNNMCNYFFPNLKRIIIRTIIDNNILDFLWNHLHIEILFLDKEIHIINQEIINILNNMNLLLLVCRECIFDDSIFDLYKFIPEITLCGTNITSDDFFVYNYDLSFLKLSNYVNRLVYDMAHKESKIEIL